MRTVYALLSGPSVLIESRHGDAKKVLQTRSVLARAWHEAYSEVRWDRGVRSQELVVVPLGKGLGSASVEP